MFYIAFFPQVCCFYSERAPTLYSFSRSFVLKQHSNKLSTKKILLAVTELFRVSINYRLFVQVLCLRQKRNILCVCFINVFSLESCHTLNDSDVKFVRVGVPNSEISCGKSFSPTLRVGHLFQFSSCKM